MKIQAFLVVGLAAVTMAATCDEPTAPDTCVTGRVMTLGAKVDGEVTKGDCKVQDYFVDSYTLTLAAQTTIRFNVTAQSGVEIRVTDPARPEASREILEDGGQASFQQFVVLPAGVYTVDVGSPDNTGTYSVQTTAVTPPEPAGCVMSPTQRLYVTAGIDVAGAITGADCVGAQAQYKNDAYVIYMVPGQLRKFTATVSAAHSMEIHDLATGALMIFKATNAAGANVLQYNPTASGYYVVGMIATPGTTTITYSFKVE